MDMSEANSDFPWIINALEWLKLCYCFHLSQLGILPNADVCPNYKIAFISEIPVGFGFWFFF